jgi:phage-related baseplate assembly protein
MPSQIDLSRLPAPEIIESLSFEQLLDKIRADFLQRHPQAAETIDLESEPVTKLLESAAYFALNKRQQFQEDARSLLLAYASGSTLDHIGITYYDTERLTLQAADPSANPPVEAVMESDQDYKRRIMLAMDSPSTAGSENGYRYHALSAHEDVKDVTAINRYAGIVQVTVLSRQGSGQASPALIDTVQAATSAERARPLNDQVQVQSATIRAYTVEAVLELRSGPDPVVVQQEAARAARDYTESRHALGEDIVKDALAAAMYVQGVERVTLTSPAQDIECSDVEAPWCESVEVSVNE